MVNNVSHAMHQYMNCIAEKAQNTWQAISYIPFLSTPKGVINMMIGTALAVKGAVDYSFSKIASLFGKEIDLVEPMLAGKGASYYVLRGLAEFTPFVNLLLITYDDFESRRVV